MTEREKESDGQQAEEVNLLLKVFLWVLWSSQAHGGDFRGTVFHFSSIMSLITIWAHQSEKKPFNGHISTRPQGLRCSLFSHTGPNSKLLVLISSKSGWKVQTSPVKGNWCQNRKTLISAISKKVNHKSVCNVILWPENSFVFISSFRSVCLTWEFVHNMSDCLTHMNNAALQLQKNMTFFKFYGTWISL